MQAPMRSGGMPLRSRASRPAAVARLSPDSLPPTMCRLPMPVRSRIQASLVSRVRA